MFKHFYVSHTTIKIKKLKIQFEMPKKDRSINLYLFDIKKIVDTLIEEHVESILDCLSSDYDNFIGVVTSRTDPRSIDEVEAILLTQEEQFEKHSATKNNVFQVNTATTYWNKIITTIFTPIMPIAKVACPFIL